MPLSGWIQRARASRADDGAGAHVHLGLQVEHELPAGQGLAQAFGLLPERLPCTLLHRVEGLHAVASALLGAIHRMVGMAQQCVCIGGVFRIERVADAGGDRDTLRAQCVGRSEVFHETVQELLGIGVRLQLGHQQHELVPAETRHAVHGAQGAGEAACHDHEEPVARAVAQPVVHRLESIEVQVGHPQLPPAGAGMRHGLLQAAGELHAVGQARERVEVGQLLEHVLLHALAGHIDADAEHAARTAAFVMAHDLAEVAHPAARGRARCGCLAGRHLPGRIEVGVGTGDVPFQGVGDVLDVGGRHPAGPVHAFGHGLAGGVRHALQLAPARVARDHARGDVPVPETEGGGRQGERQQRLAFADEVFVALALGDVVRGYQPDGCPIEFGGMHGLQQGAVAAIARVDRDFEGIVDGAPAHRVEQLPAPLRREKAQFHGRAAQRLAARNARQAFPCLVDHEVGAIGAPRHEHRMGHQLEDAHEAVFGLAQPLGRAPPLVDVLHHAPQAGDGPAFEQGFGMDAHPDRASVVRPQDLHFARPSHGPLPAPPEEVRQGGAKGCGDKVAQVFGRLGRQPSAGKAVDVEAHVRPIHQPLSVPVLPDTQARHAAGLSQHVVGGRQLVVGTLCRGQILEHRNEAVFAPDAGAAGRQQARHGFRARCLHLDGHPLHAALAAQDGQHLLPRPCRWPKAELQGGAADGGAAGKRRTAPRKPGSRRCSGRLPGG